MGDCFLKRIVWASFCNNLLYLCYILTGKGKVVGKVSNTWALNVQNLPPLTPPLHLNFVDSAKLCPWQIFLGNFGPRAWVHFSKWHSQGYSSYRRPSNPLNFKADDTLEIYIGFGTYFSQIGKIWISCRDYKCDLGCLGNYVVSNCSVVAAGGSMGQGGIWWIFQQLVDTWGQFDQLLYSSLNKIYCGVHFFWMMYENINKLDKFWQENLLKKGLFAQTRAICRQTCIQIF